MKYLDDKADTFPDGLKGTPFEIVYKALRKVAADVWAVDPTVYRAGMGWGWSALQTPEDLEKFREILINALISAFAPLVKDNKTNAELVEYLRQWREYTPTFPRLQALYALFGVTADIQPISDPESQSVMPVTDTIHAFYVRITPTDMARLLTLSEAYKIAVGASPLGARPYVYYALESDIDTTASPVPVDEVSTVFIVNDELASDPPEPPQPSYNTAYFNPGQGNDQMPTDTSWGSGGGQIELLYFHNSDQRVPYDSSKSYIVKTVFYVGGAEVTDADLAPYTVSQYVRISDLNYMGNHTGTLILRTLTNNPIYGKPCGCTYEEESLELEIFFYLNETGSSDTFPYQNEPRGAYVIDDNDKATLEAFGVVLTEYGGRYVVDKSCIDNFTWEPIGLYGGLRENDLSADMSNFYASVGPGTSAAYQVFVCIRNYPRTYKTPALTWKCRITKNS